MPPAAAQGDMMKQDAPHCHAPIHPPGPVPTLTTSRLPPQSPWGNQRCTEGNQRQRSMSVSTRSIPGVFQEDLV